MSIYQVYFTDDSLAPHPALAGFLSGYSLAITGREMDVWTITVETVLDETLISLADPDDGDQCTLRVVVLRDTGAGAWDYLCSGPLATLEVEQDAASGDAGLPGRMTLTFDSDDVYVAERITYADPTSAFTSQGAHAHDVITSAVAAETAMKSIVNRNAGPGALLARRVANLTIEADAASGADVVYSTRFEPVGDVLRSLATVGGLAFRTVQAAGPTLLFTVREPRDRSAEIVYSFGLGNLRRLRITDTAPNATVALVGGDGTGTSRVTREVADAPAVARWRRIERFVSDDSTDTVQLDQEGAAELLQDGETTALDLGVTDNPNLIFGRDYDLSDVVGYEYAPGRYRTARVTAVTIEVTREGVETVTPTIGSADSTTDARQVKINQRTARRLSAIEGT